MGAEGLLLFGPSPLHVPRCLLRGTSFDSEGLIKLSMPLLVFVFGPSNVIPDAFT